MKKFINTRTNLIGSICLAVTTLSISATPKAYEIKDFDVAGIRLGMTTAQAVDAVISKYKIDKSRIKFLPPYPNPITNKKELNSFSVDFDSNKRLQVDLEAKIPPDRDNPMIIVRVLYKMSDTPDNKNLMTVSAFDKYGEPTDKQLIGTYFWCSKPALHGIGCSQNQRGLELIQAGTSLTLQDGGYSQLSSDYLKNLKNSKPAF